MRLRLALVLGALALSGIGCGADPAPDTTPPQILSTTPADGAVNVVGTDPIRIQFDEAIDNNKFPDDLFHLALGVQPLYGQVSYDLGAHQATLVLSLALQPGALYQAILEPGVTDLAGNRRSQTYQWSFRVAP